MNRSKNFTEQETFLLLDLINKYKSTEKSRNSRIAGIPVVSLLSSAFTIASNKKLLIFVKN